MKLLKRLILGAAVLAGMSVTVHAAKKDDGFYNSPQFSTISNTAVMRLTGQFELRVGTMSLPGHGTTTYLVLSATGGIVGAFGITMGSATFNTLTLNGVNMGTYMSGGALAVYSGGSPVGNATTLKFTNAISATCVGSTCTATSASGGGNTLVFSEEGSALTGGSVTRVDCVGAGVSCTQSASTVTVTVAGGGGGAAVVENSTLTKTMTVGGEIVASSMTWPFFPGAWWSAPLTSTCTITKVQAIVQRPSVTAVFPFYAVATSSWQWTNYGAVVVTTNTQRSPVLNTNLKLPYGSSFGIGIASAPVVAPASDFGLVYDMWCTPGSP